MDLDPFTTEYDLELVGEEVISIIEEAYEVVHDITAFTDFLLCYGKAPNCVKVAGRTLWTWKPVHGERVF